MRKLFFLTFIFFSSLSIHLNLSAFEYDACFDVGVGYRQDHLNWNIGIAPEGPDILSELKWKDLQMVQVSGTTKILLCDFLYLKGKADYASIFHGSVRDSDYDGDHRTHPFSIAKAWANKGEAFDFLGGIGYAFNFCCDRFFFIPLAGYSMSEQHLRMHKGVQLLDADDSHFSVRSIPNLHSNYRAKWYTPWVGFDASYRFDCLLVYYGGFEYHWGKYKGTGHWNLREDWIGDFKHKGDAHGTVGTFGAKYPFGCHWTAGVELNYSYFKVRHGKGYVPIHGNVISSGYSNFVAKTHLNKVQWHSYSIMATLGTFF